MIKNFLLVGLGGMLGSMLRLAVNIGFKSSSYPFSTFLVNIAGSFLIGIIFGISARNSQFDVNWRLFLATGICGGFTTFSSLSAESIFLLQQQRYSVFFLYLFLSIVLGLAATWLGMTIVAK